MSDTEHNSDAVGKRILSAADLGFDAGDTSIIPAFSLLEWVAFFAFFGTIIFCATQAVISPRRTFCAESMMEDQSERRKRR
jgi:hypothetical protein